MLTFKGLILFLGGGGGGVIIPLTFITFLTDQQVQLKPQTFFGIPIIYSADHLKCFISRRKTVRLHTKRNVFINIPEFSQFQEFDFGIQLTLLSRPA